MPHDTIDMAGAPFPDQFTHSFLIRDAARSIPSIIKRAPEWPRVEYGFEQHSALFDRVAAHLAAPPPVIDSDDLPEDPHAVTVRWCDAVGLRFIPEALSREPVARPEVGWYDDGSRHDVLARSDGLKP